MKRTVSLIFLFVFIFFCGNRVFSQVYLKPGYYAVFFKDKQGTRASLDSPQTFLSARALEHRRIYHIPVTEQDLPVSQVYIDSLKKFGFDIWLKSKWLNGVVVRLQDSSQLTLLDSLIRVWDFLLPDYSSMIWPKDSAKTHYYVDSEFLTKFKLDTPLTDVYKYEAALDQDTTLKVNRLHSLGYAGQNVVIAVFDAGFKRVNKIKAFKHLFDGRQDNGELLGVYDFVDKDSSVFGSEQHGTMALSTMAADFKDMVGTAPKASFYLFRTEDESSEYKIEEFNWLVAAETADSLGVDVISSSLGYTTFDDSLMNYSYKDLNGNTAISTIAADIAASKGKIVVISAGNEGDNSWHYLSFPADADSCLAVGAVMSYPPYPVAFFSSRGPTYDGRIKPDVAAFGFWAVVVNGLGFVNLQAGTSFSAPQVAGLAACLRSAFPEMSNMDIIKAIKAGASDALHPNFNVGYGIPNAYLSYQILKYWQRQKVRANE